ncbi:hypothetical protein ES702_02575 [subsurface metagenome]
MKDSTQLRLFGLVCLIMMCFFLYISLNVIPLEYVSIGFVNSGFWLVAFLVSHFVAYRIEREEGERIKRRANND